MGGIEIANKVTTVNVSNFKEKIEKIYSIWKDNKLATEYNIADIGVFVIAVGIDENISYNKSSAFQEWLFQFDLTDTLCVLTKETFLILSNKKKIDFFSPIENIKDYPLSFKLLTRNKADKDESNFANIISIVKKSIMNNKFGIFTKDKFNGEFINLWISKFDSLNYSYVDVSQFFSTIMSVKNQTEIEQTKKAASITSNIYSKFLKPKIVQIIDSEKSIKHSELMQMVECCLDSNKYLSPDVELADVEVCFPPIIQSGDDFSLKFSALSNNNNLKFGTIICFIGFRYQYYCSALVRTLFVDPTDEQNEMYNYLNSLFDKICDRIKDGVLMSEVYSFAFDNVKSSYPDHANNFLKNIGFVTGLEFKDSYYNIDSKSQHMFKSGMILNIYIGFQNISNRISKDSKQKTYSICIGDTILVHKNETAELLTFSKRDLSHISIFSKNEDEIKAEIKKECVEDLACIIADSKNILKTRIRPEQNPEEKRRLHQDELTDQLNKAAKERLLVGKLDNQISQKKNSKFANHIAYESSESIPNVKEIEDLKIYVDKKTESVVLPLFGLIVPFHISTIKNISSNIEGDYTYFRINFNYPSSGFGKTESNLDTNSYYIRELVLRSSNIKIPGEAAPNSTNLNTAFRLIKDLHKKLKTKEAEEKELEGIVKQEDLVVNISKNLPRLKDLYMRPSISNRRMTGNLETHINGFRYSTIKGENVDVLFANIKHAFFQPCDGEMIILLHFHLKNAVLIGKKKHFDIQFYTEVGEITSDLGKNLNITNEKDELDSEQAERELRNRLKSVFKTFIERVEPLTNGLVEFDIPFRELGFHGVPFRSSVLLQPTTHCLVNLTEQPPFVVSIDNIELIHFERISFQMKNFDMVIVYKDYNKKVTMIGCIPMNSLDQIKDWLNSCDLRYSEGTQSLNWTKIMKTIVDDPDDFFANGGWTFLEPYSSDSAQSGDSEDQDGDFKISESAESDYNSDGDADSDEDYSSEASDEDEYEESELDESGKSWSELEEEAIREDNGRFSDDFDNDDDRKPPPNKKNKRK